MGKRLADVKIPVPAGKKSSIYLDADVADMLRRISRAEGRYLTPLVRDMVVSYLNLFHPDWKIKFEDE